VKKKKPSLSLFSHHRAKLALFNPPFPPKSSFTLQDHLAAAAASSTVSSLCSATGDEFYANMNALIQQQQHMQQLQQLQQQHFQHLQQQQSQHQDDQSAFAKQTYRELTSLRPMVAQAAEEPESELRMTRPPAQTNNSGSNSPKNDKKPKMNTLDVAEAEELATRIRPWELKILIEIYRTRARRNIRIKISNAYWMLYGTSKENTKNFYKLLRGERHRGEPLVLLLLWIKLAFPSPTVCCSLIDAILSTMQER